MIDTKIAELRKARGISQEQLAELLNTSRQAVSKWERGESYPDIDKLKDRAVYFNVSIDYLLGHDIESVSVQSFIAKLNACEESKTFSISLEEIRLIVSTNPNHFELLLAAGSYLLHSWSASPMTDVADAVVEYGKKALLVFLPNNKQNVKRNDIQQAIAIGYMLKNDYQSARDYLLQNNVSGANELLAECELELDHDEQASVLASGLFLDAISRIINGHLIQIRVLLRSDKAEEALDLATWSINFIHSVGKREDFFLEMVYYFAFTQAICRRYLKRDDSDVITFLKENRACVSATTDDTGDVRFYYDKKVRFLSLMEEMKETLAKTISTFKEARIYEDACAVYEILFGGENNG